MAMDPNNFEQATPFVQPGDSAQAFMFYGTES